MMDRDRDKDGRKPSQLDRRGSGGTKRPHEDRHDFGSRDAGGGPPPTNLLHLRMLVVLKKAGSVIGKGGDFIQMTKSMTGAKVGVDKPIGTFEERLVHVQGLDEPGKAVAGVQEAVLRTAERILGEEVPSGAIKLPHKCSLRMLLFRYQIGAVMGKKGTAINEIRSKSGASLKLQTPVDGIPLIPPAEPEDELITISGAPEQVLTALKLITDKLRAVPNPLSSRGLWLDSGGPRSERGGDGRGPPLGPDPKRSRGPGRDERGRDDRGPPPGLRGGPGMGGPPPGWDPRDMPPPGRDGPGGFGPPSPGGGLLGPPLSGITLALPPAARGVLANNDSVRTEGLVGPATVEYRLLLPARKSPVILGSKGGEGRERKPGVIKDIRIHTNAKVHLHDEIKGCPDRILQIMSTEDVQDERCCAFDAAMECIQALLHDELSYSNQPICGIRLIVPQPQIGAVMGKAGSTIIALRQVSGCSLHLSAHPDVPACVKTGEEVLEMRGARDAVLLACHVVLVAVRGNMARGQLIYNYAPPPGAPPLGARPPPPKFDRRGPPPELRMGGGPPGGGGRGSRWDSDSRGGGGPGGHSPQGMPPGGGPGGPPGQGMPPGAPPPGPMPGVLSPGHQGPPGSQQQLMGGYPPEQAAPPPSVRYAAAPQQQQQQQVQYVSGPPPGGLPGAPQQVVVYTNQPPPGGAFGGPGGPPPLHVPAPPGQPGQPLEYTTTTYVQGVPPPGPGPLHQVMQHGGMPGQTVVYTNAPPPGQFLHDPNAPMQQQVLQGPPPQSVTYIYTSAPPPTAGLGGGPGAPSPSQQQPQQQQQPVSAAPPSGPGSTSGYGGLASMVAAPPPAAAAPPAAAPQQAAQPAPAAAAPAPSAAAAAALPKARVLLTQDQVLRLKLDEPSQCAQLSFLSGASISLSDNVLENGAREVLLGGSDAQCNTVKNLMEALMRSS